MGIRYKASSPDVAARPFAVRLAWPLCAACLALLGLSVLFAFLGRPAPLFEESAPWHGQAIFAAGVAGAPILGALIASRRPGNPYGWVWIGFGLALALLSFGANYAEYAVLSESLPAPGMAALAGSVGWVAWVALTPFLMLLFPDGHLPSERWRWVARAVVAAGAACVVLAPFMPGQSGVASVESPFGVEGRAGVAIMALVVAGVFTIFGCTLLSMFSLVFRYRRASGVERQQIKWFVYAAVLFGGSLVFSGFLGRDLPGMWDAAFEATTLSGLYVAVGIAIFRHRLYDIDLIINRTLVYGALTACVIGTYILLVGYLGAVFQTGRNVYVSLVAAGIIAVLFAPLREKLQRSVNRLMYGERDDPYAVISRLGERMEATLEPDKVLPTIARTVREALKLPYAAISLREKEGSSIAAEDGEPPGKLVRLPISHHGEEVGEMALAPRPGEDGFSPADHRLLEDLARQAGAAAHAVRLTKDLQRSRERLVTTREEERRRLRRDLHDGLGPALGSLPMKLDVASDMISSDPGAAKALLRSLKEQTRLATSDVRRLVHELRPPALDELGLAGAVRELAAQQNGLRVTVEAPEGLSDLPAAVEVAAYRITGEAMTNAARHAGAGRCEVRIALDGSSLRLEVSDDGCGIGRGRGSGVGLHSMRERAEELGGSFEVESSPENGTTVRASLPLTRLEV